MGDLEEVPTSITALTSQHYPLSEGSHTEQIRVAACIKYEQAAIRQVVYKAINERANKVANTTMLCTSTVQLVRSGTIKILNARRVENNKRYMEKLVRKENNKKPDMKNGCFEDITFGKWTYDKGRDPATETTVRITSQLGDKYTKQRHYYIYSLKSNYGKSRAMGMLAERYNVAFVSDMKNWADVPHETQFLVFDEYDCTYNLHINQLKALMASPARGTFGQCKGASYIPRPDVQIIILSSTSPYEVYGTYNSRLKRRLISSTTANKLDDCFCVYRLDGSKNHDRRTYMSPKSWPEDEFIAECDKLAVEYSANPVDSMNIVNGGVYEKLAEEVARRMEDPRTLTHMLSQGLEEILNLLKVRTDQSVVSLRDAFSVLYKCVPTVLPLPKVYLDLYNFNGEKLKGKAYRDGIHGLAEEYKCNMIDFDWSQIERISGQKYEMQDLEHPAKRLCTVEKQALLRHK